ncbi:T9SS type A sorting domain-containing protein [Salibacter halophilus]|uniref:T9SS type A sorting domain-containing protein n=1 Tax=Salibacter halophilus TaxID=1803916 RepID=A0A6N6M3S6_9FLAO|nr:T9SS type A sorting domain-containing protein [Salibacter halophilus]KAB1062116.1 T9SS type A sorting domain-containing protein [Salibacter halophilus]
MKKSNLLIIVFCSIIVNTVNAQVNDSITANVNSQLRHMFGQLNPPNNSTHLFDMSARMTPDWRWDHYTDSTIHLNEWWGMYEELYYMAYDTTTHTETETLFEELNKVKYDTVPILAMNYNYHRFIDSTVFNSGTYFNFDIPNNVITDNPSRPSSPYTNHQLFKGVTFKNTSQFREVVFKIDPQFLLSDIPNSNEYTNGSFQIDFGDGNGFQTISGGSINYISVTYPSKGTYEITYRIHNTEEQFTFKKNHSAFKVSSNDIPKLPSDTIYEGELEVGVYDNACENIPEENQKAIVFLTGFDPFNGRDFSRDYYDLQRSELNELQLSGYDIYVVRYDNSGRDIRANALDVVNLLEYLKCEKYPNSEEQFVVMGYSMGGLIGRYALTWMEQPGNINYEGCKPYKLHNTRLFVSVDAPQQGANVPLAFQHIYKGASDLYSVIPGFARGIMDEFATELRAEMIDMQSVKQMLIYHMDTKDVFNRYHRHSEGIQLFNELDAMGNYPKYAKKTAIANGMLNSENQINAYTGDEMVKDSTHYFDGGFRTRLNILWWQVNIFDVSLQVNPSPHGNGKLIDANLDIFVPKLNFDIFGVSLTINSFVDLIDVNSTSMYPIDVEAGSYYGRVREFPQFSNSPSTLEWYDWQNTFAIAYAPPTPPTINTTFGLGVEFLSGIQSNGLAFNFIPVGSAIDFTGSWNPSNIEFDIQSNYGVSSLMGNNNYTPFDVIITNGDFTPIDNEYETGNNWDHEHQFRNDKQYHMDTGEEVRVLNREIGDDKMWLENYELNWDASFSAREVSAGKHQFFMYQYPSQAAQWPFVGVPGALSRENPMVINSGANATFYYDSNTGSFTDRGVVRNGTYEPVGLDQFYCGSDGKKLNVSSNLGSDVSKGIVIYPNPTSNKLFIKAKEDQNINEVYLFDLTGREFFTEKINSQSATIDLQNRSLSPGQYILKINTPYSTEVVKLIVK